MPGIGCVTCHTANVHGLYGSAALTLKPGMSEAARSYALWRPERHRQAMRPALLRSAEFCGACHRKSYSLPQNGFRWMPVQDEYGQWQDSNYSGQAMLAPTTTGGRKDCRGCHLDPGLKKRPALEIEAFLRPVRPDGPAPVALTDAAARSMAGADEPHYLDIVVRNSGIGHEFPTGMPDQREAWLEVRLTGPAGTAVLEAGRVRPGAPLPASAHAYRLIGTDRGGRPVNHGNLDELTNIVEHRRIPAGGADLARYAFGASRPRLGALSVRLLRRRRPEFAGWVRRATGCDDEGSECIEVLAERRWPLGSGARTKQPGDGVDAAAARWRAYGEALASVKAYPFAIQALRRSLSARPRDVAGLLALGRVFLAEGDLLAGQDQLRLARDAAGRQDPRVQAWEAVATRTAHPERAAETLAELVEQHPRDRRLRFELGRAQMDLLRNREALEQFRTMLDLDPTDAGAHYNLMLSHQRLNELSEARKEEVIYRLLASEERISPRAARGREAVEATLLHVHELEPPR